MERLMKKQIFFRNKNIKLNMIKIGKMIDELFSKLNIFLIYFTKLKELIYNLLFKSNSRCGPIKKSPLNWFYDSKVFLWLVN